MTTDDRPFVRGMPCLLCGKYGCDPHHWPVRKSKGAGNTMLDVVPLCRVCHDKVHRGDAAANKLLENSGEFHYRWVRKVMLDDCKPER